MGVWETYEARVGTTGTQRRQHIKVASQEQFYRKIISNMGYHLVTIDGVEQEIAVVRDAERDEKRIYSMPGETLKHGGLVDFNGVMWLITEKNFDNEFYDNAIMKQCNYQLKWINPDGDIITRWCIVVDGTKYLIGEKSSSIMAIGDARFAVTMAKDSETKRIRRGQRFLIDDPDAEETLAFQITKPNRFFNLYNGEGVYRYILNEVQLTDNDNVEQGIADYYSWYPKVELPVSDVQTGEPFEDIKEAAIDREEHKAETIEETQRWI